MAQIVTCPRGHAVEWPEGEPLPSAAADIYCPFCSGEDFVPFRQAAPEELRLKEVFAAAAVASSTPAAPDAGVAGTETPPRVTGYEGLSQVGQGGMSVVYRAVHTRLNRTVALKMIRAGAHARVEERVRLRTEAAAVARLRHPNIVQIFEVGEQDGLPFLALEYLDGGSLARKLGEAPLSAPAAAALVETLARAVEAAHAQGIIHRDLKPANVLLDGEGRPKITDFGLAKYVEGGTSLTQTGAVLGTPSYMAPEQAAGQTDKVGPAADIYALGAILYEVLTGRPPFRAPTPRETLEQVCNQEPLPPRRLQPRVPRDLETICLKCLRKEVGARYASAGALADDLSRFQAGQPILARPVGWLERSWKRARRRPALTALGALSLVTTIGLVTGGIWYNFRLREEVERRKVQQERAAANFQTGIDVLEHQLTELWNATQRGELPPSLRHPLLEHAISFYQKLLESGDDSDAAARRAVGRAYFGLGLSNQMLGNLDQAEAHYVRAISCQEWLLADFPEEPDYRIDLATTLLKLSTLQTLTGRSEEGAKTRHRVAVMVEHLSPGHPRLAEMGFPVVEKLANENRIREALPWMDQHIHAAEVRVEQAQPGPMREHYCGLLRSLLVTRGTLLLNLGDYREALAIWDRVLAMGEMPGRDPSSATCRAFRAVTLAYLADYEQATKAIEAAISAEEKEAGPLYMAGEVYAMAAALVLKDAKRSAEEQNSWSEEYGARAVAFLRRSEAAGFFRSPSHRDQFRTGKNFASLQSRADFRKFVSELDGAD